MKQLLENLIALYFLSADAQYLRTLLRLVQQEIATPVLQKTILTLDSCTIENVDTQMQTVGALVLSLDSCTNCLEIEGKYVPSADAVLEPGKLIRVYAAGTNASPESTECFVMSLASLSETTLVLVAPPSPDLDGLMVPEDSSDV